MFLRRLHNLPLLCGLVLCLLTSPISSSGYVWCLSADGHAELEAAVADDCGINTSSSRSPDQAEFIQGVETDGCGPCLDVSSTPQWGSTRVRDHGPSVSLSAPLSAVAVNAFAPPVYSFLTNGLSPEQPLRISGPILQHRTIVLLI